MFSKPLVSKDMLNKMNEIMGKHNSKKSVYLSDKMYALAEEVAPQIRGLSLSKRSDKIRTIFLENASAEEKQDQKSAIEFSNSVIASL